MTLEMPGIWKGVQTLVDGSAVIVPMVGGPLPATVWVVPATGDTITVEYSMDDEASYDPWPNGAVTARAYDTLLSGITHLKFQRTAGTGTTSTCGVC